MQIRHILIFTIIFILSSCNGNMQLLKINNKNQQLEQQAAEYYANEDYFASMVSYKNLLDTDQDNINYRLGYANSLLKNQQYKEAEREFNIIIDSHKAKGDQLFEAQEGVGLSLLKRGELSKARDYFYSIISEDAMKWRAINGLAIVSSLQGKFKQALEYFDIAEYTSNKHYSVLVNKSLTLALDKQYKKAINVMKQAANSSGISEIKKRKINQNLALLYAFDGQVEKAKETSKPYLTEKEYEDNAEIYQEIAKNKSKSQKYIKQNLGITNKR
jgi:Flp pilus assembly protein TadD